MKKREILDVEMKTLKGGFNPFYSVSEEGNLRIPINNAVECVKTYNTFPCLPIQQTLECK